MNRSPVLVAAVCAALLLVLVYAYISIFPVLGAGATTAEPQRACVPFSGSFSDAKSASPNASCFTKETDGYVVYVPPNVSAQSRVPLIVALSPSADAQSMVSALRLTADSLSVIIVASKVSRNDVSIQQLLPGYEEIMDESVRALPVDGNRIIFAGFSGGGMAAYGAAYFYPERVRGVITNCGRLWPDASYMPEGKLAVLITSPTDFNYDAMRNDSASLQTIGWKTYWLEFEGGHALAPPEAYLNATGWMLQEMK